MTDSRRTFLKTVRRTVNVALAAKSLGLLGPSSVRAQSYSDYRALVCVFLFGGNDSGNLLVPFSNSGYSEYQSSRGLLALPQSKLLPVATSQGGTFGFHANATELRDLYSSRKLALLANVGTLIRPITKDQLNQNLVETPLNLYSHPDQQLQWQAAAYGGDYSSGWGGRAADRLARFNPARLIPATLSASGNKIYCVGQTGEKPAALTIGVDPGLIGTTTSDSVARIQAFNDLLALASGAGLVQAASATTAEGLRQAGVLKAAMANRAPLATAFPQTDLGNQLKQIAQVIRVRATLGITRQIFFCSLGGFDTHISQLDKHASLLSQLSAAINAFYNATVELGVEQNVTAFTHSEFSRTLQPTTTLGTDHAWGGHQFIVGGGVKGGDMYGNYPSLALNGVDDVSNRGILIPTTAVDQYVSTLLQWMGLSQADLSGMLPNLGNFTTSNLGFLG